MRRGRVGTQDIVALRDVSFAVDPGESVGVIGRNGSGKTTLLRLIAGIFAPTSGRIEVGGKVASLLGLGAGFHPDFTGRENVFLNGSLHGLQRRVVRERMDEIVAFAELERFIDLPVRTYSAGMYMRLGFAVATHLEPDVLLLDEVFAVGDEAFQRKCFGRIFEFKRRGGTIFFVSHAAAAVESLCERALLLRAGIGWTSTARRTMRSPATRRCWPRRRIPEERGAGLHEWGSGEARVTEVRLADDDGAPRRQYLAGEPLVALLRVEIDPGCPPPQVAVEIHAAPGGLVAAASQQPGAARLGGGRRSLDPLRGRSPAARRRPFRARRLALRHNGGHLYHRRLAAAEFVVYSEEAAPGGVVRLDGRWSLAGDPSPVATS